MSDPEIQEARRDNDPNIHRPVNISIKQAVIRKMGEGFLRLVLCTVVFYVCPEIAPGIRTRINGSVMKLYLYMIVAFLMIGCNSNENSGELSPLNGYWVTDACESVDWNNDMPAYTDSNETWVKGIYEFRYGGQIRQFIQFYPDSSCTGDIELYEPTVEPGKSPTFVDLGEETLEEGIQGGRIAIDFPMMPDVLLDSIEGFYTINSGSLCFSRNLHFSAMSWGITEWEETNIDFEKCLTWIDQPPYHNP
jgi:hypothetical protein